MSILITGISIPPLWRSAFTDIPRYVVASSTSTSRRCVFLKKSSFRATAKTSTLLCAARLRPSFWIQATFRNIVARYSGRSRHLRAASGPADFPHVAVLVLALVAFPGSAAFATHIRMQETAAGNAITPGHQDTRHSSIAPTTSIRSSRPMGDNRAIAEVRYMPQITNTWETNPALR
jgi:hypothetical protein